MIAEHANAVLALLDADDGPPPLVVFDGVVPSGTDPPYVVCYFASEYSEALSLVGSSDRFAMRAIVHSIGANQAAARAVAGRVRAALLDVVPVIAGRTCFPIRHDEGYGAEPDQPTTAIVFDIVDVYRLESVPA